MCLNHIGTSRCGYHAGPRQQGRAADTLYLVLNGVAGPRQQGRAAAVRAALADHRHMGHVQHDRLRLVRRAHFLHTGLPPVSAQSLFVSVYIAFASYPRFIGMPASFVSRRIWEDGAQGRAHVSDFDICQPACFASKYVHAPARILLAGMATCTISTSRRAGERTAAPPLI